MLLGPNCQLNLKITNNALPFTEQALAAAHLSGSKNVVWSSAAEAAAGAKEKKQVSEPSSPLYQNFTRFWNETDIDLQMSKNMTQIPSWFNTLNLSQFWYYWSQKWFSTITWNSFLGTFAKLPLFPSMRVFDWASIQYIPPLLWSFVCVFCVFDFTAGLTKCWGRLWRRVLTEYLLCVTTRQFTNKILENSNVWIHCSCMYFLCLVSQIRIRQRYLGLSENLTNLD